MTSKRSAVTMAAILLSAWPAWSWATGVDASTARGDVPGQMYEFGGLDEVNLFNGNLTLTIPLGMAYPIGPDFDFQLRLVYNSRPWQYYLVCPIFTTSPTWFGLGDVDSGCISPGAPDPLSNAGLGWRLSLGDLLAPWPAAAGEPEGDPLLNDWPGWRYESPDGASHTFYTTALDLDWSDNATGHPCGWAVSASPCYTRDGTYLRLRPLPDGHRVVESPDGIRRLFEEAGGGRWRPVRIEDSFGHGVDITYGSDPQGAPVWTIRDDHGRLYRVEFEAEPGLAGRYRARSVHLPAFGGGETDLGLVYGPASVKPACSGDGTEQSSFGVSLLTGLEQTVGGGAGGATDRLAYGFDYFPDDGSICSHLGGRVRSLTLPTGGRYEWTYRTYFVPFMECGRSLPGPGPHVPPAINNFRETVGVGRKVALDADGTQLGQWDYVFGTFDSVQPGSCSGLDPWVAVSNVTYEEIGNARVARTESFFAVPSYYDPDAEGWTTADYGLPYTRASCDPDDPNDACEGLPQRVENPRVVDGRSYYLSRLVHRCDKADRDTPVFASGERLLDPSCRLYRSEYVRYERSFAGCSPSDGSCSQIESRPAGELTVFDDDGGIWELTEHDDFAGFGRYRIERTAGTFVTGDADPSNVRIHETHYLPEGSYRVDPGGVVVQDVSTPLAGAPWILDRFSFEQVSEPGKGLARTETCFGADGFLRGRRIVGRNDGAHRPTDVVVKYTQGGGSEAGFPVRELSYGGDRLADADGVGIGDLCAVPTAAGSEYEIDRSYVAGVLASSRDVDSDGSTVLSTADRTVDATGLVAASRDPAGLETRYAYDDLGRRTEIVPPGAAVTITSYATDRPAGPQVIVSRKDRPGGVLLAEERFVYDGLGRLVEERRKMPEGEAVRRTRYFPSGRIWKRSELRSDFARGTTGPVWTTYSDYDPFGRPGTVTPPDGPGFATRTTWFGVRDESRKTTYQAADGQVHEAASRRLYDRQGRLVKVLESSAGAAAAPVGTRYSYDVAGRLTGVTTGAQSRLFQYDHRGFLLSESHPEVEGAVHLGGYDSWGNPGTRTFAPWSGGPRPWSFDLAYRYDRAGRRTQVLREGRPLEEWFYARANIGGDFRAGKLVQTKRRNKVVARRGAVGATAEVVVTESYEHRDPGGRISAREVRSSDGTVFRTGFTYDLLGKVASVAYPACSEPAACSAAVPQRTVSFLYEDGLLASVPGFADSIGYHPNGMWSEIRRASGGVDEQTLYHPASGLTLPGTISHRLPDGTMLFSLGPYTYDGARNVTAIGADRYFYDPVQRLVKARLFVAGIQQPDRDYTYDAYGNLLAVATNGAVAWPDRDFAVEPSTNRLVGTDVEYDQAGDLIASWGISRLFDPLGRLVEERGTGVARQMLYTAEGERVAVLDLQADRETWTPRDLGQRVLRRASSNLEGEDWRWEEDYVFRGGSLLAGVVPDPAGGESVRHFVVDHLGTVRAITDAAGNKLFRLFKYWPYGEVANGPVDGREAFRFAGHERDFDCPATTCVAPGRDDLDAMHARYYSPWAGRFLSVDPAPRREASGRPQVWNRYAYALGSPVGAVDPDGRAVFTLSAGAGLALGEPPLARVDVGLAVTGDGQAGLYLYVGSTHGVALDSDVSVGYSTAGSLSDFADAKTATLEGDFTTFGVAGTAGETPGGEAVYGGSFSLLGPGLGVMSHSGTTILVPLTEPGSLARERAERRRRAPLRVRTPNGGFAPPDCEGDPASSSDSLSWSDLEGFLERESRSAPRGSRRSRSPAPE